MKDKRILITGGTGMLGGLLAEKSKEKNEVYVPSRADMDITDREKVLKTLKSFNPGMVVHCAAFTDVDGCEEDKNRAYNVNARGTQNIAEGCADAGIRMIYISTDFVFDGKKTSPYAESDNAAPLSVYGRTKLLGEYYVSHMLQRFTIVRVSRIFGDNGRNFASSLPVCIKKGEKLFLTEDLVNSPTYADDLVNALMFIAENRVFGIINVCNSGECSWMEYGLKAKEILKAGDVELVPVRFADFKNKKAERPRYSVLSTELLESFGFSMPSWEDSLRSYLLKRA